MHSAIEQYTQWLDAGGQECNGEGGVEGGIHHHQEQLRCDILALHLHCSG